MITSMTFILVRAFLAHGSQHVSCALRKVWRLKGTNEVVIVYVLQFATAKTLDAWHYYVLFRGSSYGYCQCDTRTRQMNSSLNYV